jgi:hypothetical protein
MHVHPCRVHWHVMANIRVSAPMIMGVVHRPPACHLISWIDWIERKVSRDGRACTILKIEQQTHGPGSPAVGHTGGNVTIHQESAGQKP